MMPPLAFSSSTAMVAPHTTPSPVMAEGPLMADAKPTRIGWAQAGRAVAAVNNSARMIRMSVLLWIRFSVGAPPRPTVGEVDRRVDCRATASADDRELRARAREAPRAVGGDLHGVLHLDAAPAVL